jgi:oxalate---CoA ligase
MIDAGARANPLAPALLAPGRPDMSYGQLLACIARIASGLRSAGVDHDDRVALALPNGPELACAIVATGAYVACAPLDPTCREEELRGYLGTLRPKALIVPARADSRARTVAEELGIRCLDASWSEAMPAGMFDVATVDREASAAPSFAGDNDVALLLHTSGTTSRPKLVPLTHRNLVRSAANVASALALCREDRCLNVMPLFHIHGIVAALLGSLAAGASVVCTAGMREGQFFAWVDALRPTWYTAVPAQHEAVLAELKRYPTRAFAGRFRLIRSASAPLSPRLAAELEAELGAPVIEAYGMTEAAHQITSNPLPPLSRKQGSVGLPAGPEVAVRNDAGHILERSGYGEIVIRGENVTKGYVADSEANRATHVDGWFRTGDLGRIDDDGYITLTGRLHEIINRGGEKVSPREIDDALAEHPAVRRAAAFAVTHPTLGEDVAAAVVLNHGSRMTERDIREFLFGRLAAFKVPSRVVLVDEIPAGATGKIQRNTLAARLAALLTIPRIAPGSEIEIFVAEVFAEVLGLERVGANDNFFALGGDSLRGGQVLARVRMRTGLTVLPLALFKSPTVSEFARELEGASEREGSPIAERLDRVNGRVDPQTHRIPTRDRRRRGPG